MEFYSYLWLREDGTPYYVGKGTGNRAWVRESHHCFPPKDRSRILIFPQDSEADAFESEMALIALFGRKDNGTGTLRNMTDGGDGSSGYKHTLVGLQKMSAAHKGKRHSPATEFTSETWKGKKRPPRTAEHRRKISEANKGKGLGHPDRTGGANLGNKYALGRKHTAEWKALRSAQQKQWWDERRAKRVTISLPS